MNLAKGNLLGHAWGLNPGGDLNTFQWGSTHWCPLVMQLNSNTTVAVEGDRPFAKDWFRYKRALAARASLSCAIRFFYIHS